MPRRWNDDIVSTPLTTPRVSLPVRWSCFSTMSTVSPGLTSSRPLPSTSYNPSLLIIPQEVDGVLLQILPPVVVAHDGLRVPVLTHHLHLPVREPRLQRARDGRPPQVVRREVAESGVVGPPLDDLLRHA